MEIFIWVIVYLIFAIISGVFSAKKPRKTPPPPRREPPIIIKQIPVEKPPREATFSTVIEEEEEKEKISLEEEIERGGFIEALPFTPDRVLSGIIYSQILRPPVGLRFIPKKISAGKTISQK